jgi:hypothetical protein
MAVVDAHPLGATRPVHVHQVGEEAVVAHQVGEEAAAQLLAGVEVVGALLMVAVVTGIALLTAAAAAATVHVHPMVEAPHTEERLHTEEERLMAETMAHARHTVASTQATARLHGVAHPATPQNHRAVSPLLHLAHTMRQHPVHMRPPLPVLMVRTRLLLQAVLWMLQHLETSPLLRQGIPDTSTAQHLQRHQRQGLGNQLHRRRAVKTRATIEVSHEY